MAKTPVNVLDSITELPPVDQTDAGETVTVSDIVGKETPGTVPEVKTDAEETPGIDSAVAAAKNAAAEVAETPTAETAETTDTEEDDDTTQAVANWNKLTEDWEKDPSLVAIDIWKQMPPEAQDKFLKHLVGSDKSSIPKDYEGVNDFEKALLPHVDTLASIAEWKESTQEKIDSHANFINSGLVHAQTSTAILETFAKAFGVEVPKVDTEKVLKAVQAGKGWEVAMKPYRQALDKMAGEMRQGLKARPADNTDTSREQPVILASDSIAVRIAKAKAGGLKLA